MKCKYILFIPFTFFLLTRNLSKCKGSRLNSLSFVNIDNKKKRLVEENRLNIRNVIAVFFIVGN